MSKLLLLEFFILYQLASLLTGFIQAKYLFYKKTPPFGGVKFFNALFSAASARMC